MQKVIRRTVLAEKQAARRLERRKDKDNRTWRKTNREQNLYSRKESTTALKAARFNRREDWELGPLAPRRDVGDMKDRYGTVSTQALRGPILENDARKKARELIGGKYMNIVKGDRVVLLEGRDKGKIGKITQVDTDRCEFTVEGLNMVTLLSNPNCFPLLTQSFTDRCISPRMDDQCRRI
jgi:large subunit ribosomal protein L24